jgi:hypothetical protein
MLHVFCIRFPCGKLSCQSEKNHLIFVFVYFGFSAREREGTGKQHVFLYPGLSKTDVGLELEELEEAAELTLQEERLTTAEDSVRKEDGAPQDPLLLMCRNIQDKLTLASHDSDDSEDDSEDDSNDSEDNSSESDDSSENNEQDEKKPTGEPLH